MDYLVGPEWTDDPPLSEGSATNGTVTWASDVVSAYPTTLTLTLTPTLTPTLTRTLSLTPTR